MEIAVDPGRGFKTFMHLLLAALIGLVSGITSGMFGVGGGIVMVPAMTLLLKLDIKTAIGTSLVVIIPTALAGSAKHYHLGNINWNVALSLIPLALVGGFIGAWATGPIAAVVLKRIFGLLLVLVGLRLILSKTT